MNKRDISETRAAAKSRGGGEMKGLSRRGLDLIVPPKRRVGNRDVCGWEEDLSVVWLGVACLGVVPSSAFKVKTGPDETSLVQCPDCARRKAST